MSRTIRKTKAWGEPSGKGNKMMKKRLSRVARRLKPEEVYSKKLVDPYDY